MVNRTSDKETGLDHMKLLQGRYEVERLPEDISPERMVPDFAFNVLNPLGLLYKPVVDEKFLANGGEKLIWPDGKPFAVCLSHDVDVVCLSSFHEFLRKRRIQLANIHKTFFKIKGYLGIALEGMKAGFRERQKDPFHCYERWLEVEKEVGARSTFFFWPGWSSVTKHHYTDSTYELSDLIVFDNQKCTVAEMIQEIDRRGWEIGLHPSWYSFYDIEEMKRQKESIERSLGKEVISIRQHYLHYDIRITPRVQAEAGFKYDSTLGFNDNVGFRFGTCYPWQLYDLESEKELPIVEIPLIMQDSALLNPRKGMRLDEDTAFRYVIQMAEAVEKVGGVCTILWHPHSVVKPDWWNLYLRTLQYLREKGPWFATMREIGEWLKGEGEIPGKVCKYFL